MKVRKKLTQAALKRVLHYDPMTGEFTWLKRMGTKRGAGQRAGCCCATWNYRIICIKGVAYRENRLAYFYMKGKWPNCIMDHINGITDDNRWENLRAVTYKQNSMNLGIDKRNKSGCTGVIWDKNKGKWRAYLVVDGVQKHLGMFVNKQDAIAARRAAAIEYYGEYSSMISRELHTK